MLAVAFPLVRATQAWTPRCRVCCPGAARCLAPHLPCASQCPLDAYHGRAAADVRGAGPAVQAGPLHGAAGSDGPAPGDRRPVLSVLPRSAWQRRVRRPFCVADRALDWVALVRAWCGVGAGGCGGGGSLAICGLPRRGCAFVSSAGPPRKAAAGLGAGGSLRRQASPGPGGAGDRPRGEHLRRLEEQLRRAPPRRRDLVGPCGRPPPCGWCARRERFHRVHDRALPSASCGSAQLCLHGFRAQHAEDTAGYLICEARQATLAHLRGEERAAFLQNFFGPRPVVYEPGCKRAACDELAASALG